MIKTRNKKELLWKWIWHLIPEKYYMTKHGVDSEKFYQIKKKYQETPELSKGLKYLRFNVRFKGRLNFARKLKLHQSAPKRILDIGTGVGYFPFICNSMGHRCTAFDLGDFPLFNEMIEFLKVDRKVYAVKEFEPLPPVKEKFDLITAFLICFNNHNHEGLWGIKEWDFFLRDLSANQLTPNGEVFFQFNYEWSDGKPFSEELQQFFLNHGARISDNEVEFKSMQAFR